MAIPYVQSIDLNDFQLLNFVVHSAGSAPTNSSTLGGMMWWDSTNYDLKVYNDNDTAWNSLVQGPASTSNGSIPTWNSSNGNKLATGYSVNTEVGDPGVDTALVTDQGIREAIDTALSGGVTYIGGYNAATNVPDLDTSPSGISQGDMYTVTADGTFFTENVQTGDVLISQQDNPTTLAHWTIVERNIADGFISLTDTPSAYTASGGFMVMVDSTPDALEFIDPSGYGLSNFDNDVVSFGAANRIPYMNSGATDFDYVSGFEMNTGVLYVENARVTALAGASTRYATIDADGDIGVTSDLTLTDLTGYADGSIIIGGAADWTTLVGGTSGYVLTMGASRPEWSSPGAPSAHALLGTAHSDTATATVSRGSLIYGNSTPAWDELVVGTTGQVLQSDGTDVAWGDDLVMANTAYIRSGNTLGDTLLIGAYDVDGVAEFSFITLTSSNTPTCDLSTSVTIGSNDIAYDGGAFHNTFSDLQGGTTSQYYHLTSAQHTIATQAASTSLSGYLSSTDWNTFDGKQDAITDGSGLTFSGDTLNLDINSLSTETTIADGDFLPFWDITATATNKKISFSNLVTQVEAGLTAVAKVVTGDLGSGATPTITHNLNKTEVTDIIVQIWRQSDGKQVGVELTAATADTVTVNFGSAAINGTLGDYRYVVTGVQE